MSQATMEPAVADDAIGNPSNDAAGANADDQLSKLAGNEIDRLLEESESERAPAPAARVSQPDIDTADFDAKKAEIGVAAEIDDLVAGMDQPGGAPAPSAATDEAPSKDAATTDAATAEEERLSVLAAELEVDGPAVAEIPIDAAALGTADPAEIAENASDGHVSLLLRLLIWINAPMAGFSDAMRSVIGKAAILTFLNAVALMVYVVVFRKTHP